MPYKLYWDGLKFGMLLQLAVGPMCLMVFNTAKNAGFWDSVLTSKIMEDNLKKTELTVFSIGLISATLFFLSAVAGLGTVLSSFLPDAVSKGLNILVGLLILFFGIKMLLKKEK